MNLEGEFKKGCMVQVLFRDAFVTEYVTGVLVYKDELSISILKKETIRSIPMNNVISISKIF